MDGQGAGTVVLPPISGRRVATRIIDNLEDNEEAKSRKSSRSKSKNKKKAVKSKSKVKTKLSADLGEGDLNETRLDNSRGFFEEEKSLVGSKKSRSSSKKKIAKTGTKGSRSKSKGKGYDEDEVVEAKPDFEANEISPGKRKRSPHRLG